MGWLLCSVNPLFRRGPEDRLRSRLRSSEDLTFFISALTLTLAFENPKKQAGTRAAGESHLSFQRQNG